MQCFPASHESPKIGKQHVVLGSERAALPAVPLGSQLESPTRMDPRLDPTCKIGCTQLMSVELFEVLLWILPHVWGQTVPWRSVSLLRLGSAFDPPITTKSIGCCFLLFLRGAKVSMPKVLSCALLLLFPRTPAHSSDGTLRSSLRCTSFADDSDRSFCALLATRSCLSRPAFCCGALWSFR